MSEAINMDSYQNGPGGGGVREVDFQRLTQNVGTNIQKILQNGKPKSFSKFWSPENNMPISVTYV